MTARFSTCCKPYDTDHANRSLAATPVKSSDPFILPIKNTRNPLFPLVFEYQKLGPKVPKSHPEGVFRRVPKRAAHKHGFPSLTFHWQNSASGVLGATPKWAT